MNTVLIIVMVIFATIGICTLGTRLYAFSVRLQDRVKIRRKRIANIDVLNNNVCNNRNSIGKTFKLLTKLDTRVGIIEVLADNFERDMDTYHKKINEDIDKRMKVIRGRITKLEGNRLPIDNSFKHFVDKFEKLERVIEVHRVSLKGLDDVQLIHAHSISKLEKAKK